MKIKRTINKLLLSLAIVSSFLQMGCATASSTRPSSTCIADNEDLTKQIAAILIECQKIKPGMTRAELMKVFTTEGGLSTTDHQTFVYRQCPYVKIDVDFTLSNPTHEAIDGEPTDIIAKVSKPYLELTISD